MPRHSRYPAFPNNNQLYRVIKNFQRFSTRLSLVTILSLGIHPHPHMQTFKAKNKTDIKAIKQNWNIWKGCVYKPWSFHFSLYFAKTFQTRLLGKAARKHWARLSFIRLSGHVTWRSISPLWLRQSAMTTVSVCRPPAGRSCWAILPEGVTVLHYRLALGRKFITLKAMTHDTSICQSSWVSNVVYFTFKGFLLLMIMGNYSLRVKQYLLAE